MPLQTAPAHQSRLPNPASRNGEASEGHYAGRGVNRATITFLALTAVVVVGVAAALIGFGDGVINRWTLMGALLVVLMVSRLALGR